MMGPGTPGTRTWHEPGPARPTIPRARRPASFRHIRSSLHRLAGADQKAGRLPLRLAIRLRAKRPRAEACVPPDYLPRSSRVRDDPRIRSDGGLPQPRRAPHVPVGEQFLLAGRPKREDDHGTKKWRDLGRPEAALVGTQFIRNDNGKHQAPWVVQNEARFPWIVGDSGLKVGASSATVASRSTTRRPHRLVRPS